MPVYIALLRGINVGGRNLIAMADLRALAESLGLKGARTLLQSGNLVFEVQRRTPTAVAGLLERETKARFGLAIDYIVRTATEWKEIIAANPFPAQARDDPGHLVVMCLKTAPDARAVKSLQAAILGRETVQANGRELYITYPDGIGQSKLTNTVIERTLGARGTARNWNTSLKLNALAGN